MPGRCRKRERETFAQFGGKKKKIDRIKRDRKREREKSRKR